MEESPIGKWLLAAQIEDWLTFNSLQAQVYTRLFRFAFKILGNTTDAAEAAQEAIVKAFWKRSEYDPGRSNAAWLIRITTNCCLDVLRKRRQGTEESIDKLLSDYPETDLDGALSEKEIQIDALQMKELIAALRPCLKALKPMQRLSLGYRAFGEPRPDFTKKQIDQAASRARKSLRKCLRNAGHEFREI